MHHYLAIYPHGCRTESSCFRHDTWYEARDKCNELNTACGGITYNTRVNKYEVRQGTSFLNAVAVNNEDLYLVSWLKDCYSEYLPTNYNP